MNVKLAVPLLSRRRTISPSCWQFCGRKHQLTTIIHQQNQFVRCTRENRPRTIKPAGDFFRAPSYWKPRHKFGGALFLRISYVFRLCAEE